MWTVVYEGRDHRYINGLDTGRILVLVGVFFTPYWFLHPSGVNFGVADLALTLGAIILVLTKSEWPIAQSRMTAIGIVLFLFACLTSVFYAPIPMAALLDAIQYFYLFVIVLPALQITFSNPNYRMWGFIALFISLNLFVCFVAVEALFTPNLKDVALGFSNQNPVYWLVACAVFFDTVVAIQIDSALFRTILLGFILIGSLLIFGGFTLSAILLLVVGWWLIAAMWVVNRDSYLLHMGFILGTILCTILGTIIIIIFWERIILEGNIQSRLRQYQIALQVSAKYFPLGVGLESSPIILDTISGRHADSIHNVFLAYLVEIGVTGAIGIAIIWIEWIRSVLVRSIKQVSNLSPTVAAFGGFLLICMFQNVPVQRFWWVLFALSWSIVSHSSR